VPTTSAVWAISRWSASWAGAAWDEADRWLAEGADDFRAAAAGAWRTHPEILAARSIYLSLRDGSGGRLDAENREAGRRGPQTEACLDYLASLLRRGKTDEALEYLRGFPEAAAPYHLTLERGVFLVGRDLDAARAECRRAISSAGRTGYRGFLVVALKLVGQPEEARRVADELGPAPSGTAVWQALMPFTAQVSWRANRALPVDVEALAAGSRMKRFLAYDMLGFGALGRGDRDAARALLRKADEHPPLSFNTYLWMRAIRARVLADDPIWPPWLAEKK
jgi:hypothetical protein